MRLSLIVGSAFLLALPAGVGATAEQATTKTPGVTKPVDPAWRPLIQLVGDGDPHLASERFQLFTELQNTMVNNTLYDKQTQAFVDDMWASLENFNLKQLYQRLPIADGNSRALQVNGRWLSDTYAVSMVNEGTAQHKDTLKLGDSDLTFKVTHLKSGGFTSQYALSGKFSLGVGASGWQSVQAAAQEALLLGSSNSQQFYSPFQTLKHQVVAGDIKRQSPELPDRDVKFLLPFWMAYPNLVKQLGQFLIADSILAEDLAGKDYRSYKAKFRIDDKALATFYPRLASYLSDLHDIARFTVKVNDEHGTLVTLTLDSAEKSLELQATLSNGGMVPVANGKLLRDKVQYLDGEPTKLTADIQADIDVYGVKTRVSNLSMDIAFTPFKDSAQIEASIHQPPQVSVAGAFLDIVPTSLIDAVIPSNIAGIVGEFLDIACSNGINGSLVLHNTGQKHVMRSTATGYFVALDNPFVRMGMGIVNNRVVPDETASQEMEQLFFSVQRAFRKDFAAFMEQYQQIAATDTRGQL